MNAWENFKTQLTGLCLIMAGIFILSGCASQPKPWNIKVTKATSASIQVDLVGINSRERSKWEGYSMDQYWQEGDSRRAKAKKITQNFRKGEVWVVSIDDEIWQDWMNNGVNEVALIANLPGKFPPGSADPRLNFFPLERSAWSAKNKTLEFEVQDTIVNALTPMKAK